MVVGRWTKRRRRRREGTVRGTSLAPGATADHTVQYHATTQQESNRSCTSAPVHLAAAFAFVSSLPSLPRTKIVESPKEQRISALDFTWF